MGRITMLALVIGWMAGCQTGTTASALEPQTSPSQDVSGLSDDFDSSDTLKNWRHIDQTERWGADQLEKCSIENGNLVLMPRTSTWYMDYRGALVYKDIEGDFVMTTKVRASNRAGNGAPLSDYSLAGLMVRTPRGDTAQSWRPGKENYVFLSIGSADQPGRFQYEVKTTQNSQSNLEKQVTGSGDTYLQIAKIGSMVYMLKKPAGGSWSVHKRYNRPDMPAKLQAGMTVYTDYSSASQLPAQRHNGTAITGGRPDLVGRYDFVHYKRPKVPAGTNMATVSDQRLLQFLGDSAL